MNTSSYQGSLIVNTTPEKAYTACTEGFSHWWTDTQDQSFRRIGDRIKFTFPPNASYWTFEAKQLIPGEKIVLQCVEAHHIMLDKLQASQTEWLGTEIQWTFRSEGSHTNIEFIHEGLTPDLHCFEVCQAGWDFFFTQSLQAYLNTGKGMPHPS